jgi:hypothetical protein
MSFGTSLAIALTMAAAFAAAPARAATCQAGKLTCATTMPVGGYCECTKHGDTQGGTVVAKSTRHRPVDATAGGCGAHPDAPGCR